MSGNPCFIMNMSRAGQTLENKPPIAKEKVMSYEEKSVGSTAFFKCEACPYMAFAEDDIKFHLFTVHPELARTNGLADNIHIACPGCSSVFEAEETLRTHLRNHHKMGIKDVKKMIKSLVQIALKHAKLKREDKIEEPPPIASRQETPDMKMPEVIEITPNATHVIPESLPKGVAYISVDELQKMSTPNFEKIDPKDIIQEASINIVYTNDVGAQYVNVTETSVPTTCSIIQVQSVPPDLISSIQPRNIDNNLNPHTDDITPTPGSYESTYPPIKPKPGRPYGARSRGNYKSDGNVKEIDVEQKLGSMCSVDGCHVRLKDSEKLAFHRTCHSNGKYVCTECKNMFLCTESLHTHLWKAHGVDLDLPTCEICGYKTYKRHRLINIHMKCHGTEKPFPCPICQKAFKNVAQLAKHKTIHKKEGPVECPKCHLEFSSKRRLGVHTAEVHEKLKPFKCSDCPYSTARKAELKVHMRMHTGDKPYSCDQCSYRSADHNAMRRHKKQHSKDSLYTCKYCPYTTIQSTVFASHMISKHPSVCSNDLHRCPYCPFKSINKDKYVSHLTKHSDKEGIQLLIEMNKNATNKPSWTIPSENADEKVNTTREDTSDGPSGDAAAKANDILEVYDCDSQQDNIPQEYPKNYSTHPLGEPSSIPEVTDLSKDDTNSDCLITETSTEIVRHQYPQQHLPTVPYGNSYILNPTVSLGQSILPASPVALTSMSNIMGNFPIRLPSIPKISVRNNITLKADDKIPLPMTKFTGPIILPVPSSSSPVSAAHDDGAPRKKPKISVKSNLVLKGPDQVNMFHSQQKMAFKQLEDSERFGLGGPVTFNNLITNQYIQLPRETPSASPTDAIYPAPLLDAGTPPAAPLPDNTQMFFPQQLNPNTIMLPPQPKIQAADPSYIKLEGTIKQNTQSPSLERMCTEGLGASASEYKASPPPEDLHKNIGVIKNEVKSDFFSIPMAPAAANPSVLDQYLMDNLIGDQYPAHGMDLSSIVMVEMGEEPQSDVIEIDDNSDDTKLPRYDMSFPIESLYLMHNDFHFLDSEMPAAEAPAADMSRYAEGPKETLDPPEGFGADFPNFIEGKKDPMMNTCVKPGNKINVKNIELMKN